MSSKVRVVVFGGTGFVGKRFQALLHDTFDITCVGSEVNLGNIDAVQQVFDVVDPHHVVFMSALSSVDSAAKNSAMNFAINTTFLSNVLEVCKLHDLRGKVLYVSSSEVYGYLGSNNVEITETTTTTPDSIYGIAKLCGETVVTTLANLYSIKFTIARPFNHVGSGQNLNFILPKLCDYAAAKKVDASLKPIKLYNLFVYRDYTHVDDVVFAYKLMLEDGKSGVVYNVCSGESKNTDDLIKIVENCYEVDFEIDVLNPNFSSGKIFGSFKKIKSDLGWHPKLNLVDAVDQIKEFQTGDVRL